MTVIELPWPSKDLHPNTRNHWGAKARATKKARADAVKCARLAKATQIDAERLSVSVTFSPPDKRRRDEDGMLSACKAYFDAIAEVIGVDDHKWKFTTEVLPPVRYGNVRVTISPVAKAEAG